MGITRCVATACLVGGTVLAGSAQAGDQTYKKVSFYFAAHEDDWQLFMNPTAFADVAAAGTKVVFVHMTAGDAGLGMGNAGRKHPYFLARENGAEAAMRFMADGDRAPAEKASARLDFNGHKIYRVSYRNTVGYFLRVPDGNFGGAGYPSTGTQSLKRLAEGTVHELSAIDGSTTYHRWSDLVASVRAILDFERGSAPSVQLNVAEPNPKINPSDHSDHLMTAKAALDAAQTLSCARRFYYVDYASAQLPENLNPKERDFESAVFAVTAAGIRALDHPSSWQHYDRSYVGRNYFRVEEGTGACDGPGLTVARAQEPRAVGQYSAVRQNR